MVMTKGKLVAIQAEDGQVYMGYVSGVDESGKYTVDVIADRNYRGTSVGEG